MVLTACWTGSQASWSNWSSPTTLIRGSEVGAAVFWSGWKTRCIGVTLCVVSAEEGSRAWFKLCIAQKSCSLWSRVHLLRWIDWTRLLKWLQLLVNTLWVLSMPTVSRPLILGNSFKVKCTFIPFMLQVIEPCNSVSWGDLKKGVF